MRLLSITLSVMLVLTSACRNKTEVKSISTPPAKGRHKVYVSGRKPLRANPLVKLPIGAIEPKGWLLSQLQLQRDGFIGHLPELSRFLDEKSGWHTFKSGDRGWEEVPYWLKGYGDLGYILKDQRIIDETKRWLDMAMKSQDGSGYFGPPDNKENHDLWPNMVMLFVAQSRYESTHDKRILPFMTRYFRYQHALDEEYLLPKSWQKFRGGENLQSIYWLYNRTGDKWLLDLAEKVYNRTHNWEEPILNAARESDWKPSEFYHGVNIGMGIRYPGLRYQQKGDKRLLDSIEMNYKMIMDNYGQPGGVFAADENIRPGFSGPEQAAESCTMVELMHSWETLLSITGNTMYADRCEEIAFNSLPASMTEDLKALHYLTAANMISCDSSGDHTFENGGEMVSFNPWRYRCCQHNIAFGWPYFAEHLWMATLDHGLAALLYAPCSITARVGESAAEVTISVDTDYPFENEIIFTMHTDSPLSFPLYLRIPEWCKRATVMINAHHIDQPVRENYAAIERLWQNGDQIRLQLDMGIEAVPWREGEAVSIKRGPLWYSLKIEEQRRRYAGTGKWPAIEILPASDWNYGLNLNIQNLSHTVSLTRQVKPAYQPFNPADAPIELSVSGRKIKKWKKIGQMAGPLPAAPFNPNEESETLKLIPMGCARLRITVFPLLED